MTLTDRLAGALPINLDELERLAKTAARVRVFVDQPKPDAETMFVFEPDTILALVALARKAPSEREGPHCPSCDCGNRTEPWDGKGAVKQREPERTAPDNSRRGGDAD